MTINEVDLKQFRSSVVSDGDSNGGRLSTVEVNSGISSNLFSPADTDAQAAGFQSYRKTFLANHGTTKAFDAKAYIEKPTAGGDEIMFFAGTQTDTQGGITGSEALFGCGNLNADATSLDTLLLVDVHDWANAPIFRNSVLLRVSDKTDIKGAGNTEFVSVHSSTPITAVGNLVTIPLATPLVGNYAAASTRVSAVYEHGDMGATADAFALTTASGTYDGGTYPLVTNNKGSIEQIWTLTFDDASNFTVSGDTLGSIGSGSIGADFSPTNPDYTEPYFTLDRLGFGGTWAGGETLVFPTHPSAMPLWAFRDGPAGISPEAGNSAVLALLVGGE